MRSGVRSPSAPPRLARDVDAKSTQTLRSARTLREDLSRRAREVLMSRKLIGFLAIVAALGLIPLGVTFAIGFMWGGSIASVPSRVLLEADFETEIEEWMPDDPVSRALGAGQATSGGARESVRRAS